MQTIFNKRGRTVGWLSGNDIYDTKGNFIGFFIVHAVYNSSSEYCGRLKQSFFRDTEGRVVAFLQGAKGGPALPALKSIPTKPIKKPRPSTKVAHTVPSVKPLKPSWSKQDWEGFIMCASNRL